MNVSYLIAGSDVEDGRHGGGLAVGEAGDHAAHPETLHDVPADRVGAVALTLIIFPLIPSNKHAIPLILGQLYCTIKGTFPL